MTLIWAACVAVAWAAATGQVVGYHTELGGVAQSDAVDPKANVCITERYEPVVYRVAAFDAGGNTGLWSDPRELERVHNFDADGSGTIGLGDFGLFSDAFSAHYLPTGAVAP